MTIKIFNSAIAGLGLPKEYQDILLLIFKGYTNGQIAEDRGITIRQVENVVHRAREKLGLTKQVGVSSRIEIVNEIWKRGTT